MVRKSLLEKYVHAALVRLCLEQAIYRLQAGLFVATLFAVIVVVASRLFVLPYYGRIAWAMAVMVLVVTSVLIIYKRLRKNEAVHRLDAYMPDNLLITALDEQIGETHLARALTEAAESQIATAFEGFTKRKKHYTNPKMLGGFIVLATCLTLLIYFPSEAQLEAGALEKEKELIEDIKKDVQDLIKKEPLPEVEKELQELGDKLMQAELSEEVLKELIKKQKELRLKEQRLADKKEAASQSDNPTDALTEAEEQELAELGELADQLAQQVGEAHSTLNKIGKAPTLPTLADGNSSTTTVDGKPGTAGGESQGAGTGEGASQSQEGQENGEEKGSGQGQGSDSGQNAGSGQGQGQGAGQGEGQGAGSAGSEAGQGQGSSGSGAGKGSGGRDLLSVPFDRLGEKGESSIVGGNLGQGDFIEERETQGPVGKGTIRPYKEVVGDYKEAYLKSTDKMKLSPDLQHILSDYFSSIE
ncbi:hypothetical protein MKY34_19435 [Sporosarcina sp. FSL K6-1522]|uniref:hypothetical protein n=1 Tax=Sporosarcina sp. FSL K6-1522 TaxID=2921554 RepID=UPI00315A12FA